MAAEIDVEAVARELHAAHHSDFGYSCSDGECEENHLAWSLPILRRLVREVRKRDAALVRATPTQTYEAKWQTLNRAAAAIEAVGEGSKETD